MPYTLNLGLLDRAEYYSAGFPVFAGSIVNPAAVGGSGAAFDAATTSTPAPLTLSFASAAVPPTTASATLVRDTGTGGDVLRSGVVTALPPSPATATVITIDPILIPAARVSAATAGRGIPPTVVPHWIRLLSGVLTLGLYVPLVAVLGAPTVTLGPGTVTVTVTGSLAVRVFYFFVRTHDIGVTVTMTPAPSNDPEAPSRVLRTPATASSLVSVMSSLPSGLGLLLASTVASTFESVVNDTIASTARTEVTGLGMRLTPSAVICARRMTVVGPSAASGGGINLQLAVSDLVGPAIVPAPRTLAVSISPPPRATVLQTYTVTVTDVANGSPVPMATVTLRNYVPAGGSAIDVKATDAGGRALFTVSLRARVTSVVVISSVDTGAERERESVTTPPTLTVDAAGFNSIRIVLL